MNKFSSLLLLLVFSCISSNRDTSGDAVEGWENWKSERMSILKSPDGFLNLAGLYWLQEGDNTFGADSTNTIPFPDDFPENVGNFQLRNKIVTILDLIDGVTIDSLGAKETIVFDQEGSINKLMEYGTYRWFVIERAGNVGIRLQNLDHPDLKKEIDIKYFDYNPQLAVQAEFIPYSDPKKLKITNVLGHEFEMNISGQLRFEFSGKKFTLEPMDEGEKFFIIFSDETSALETYGSGRYMYTKRPEEGGMVKLDFNRAYNPPCAFTDFATCLIPPPENRLTIRIEAGEYDYHME